MVELQAEPSAKTVQTQVSEIKNCRVGYFSSIEGTVFARLEFAGMGTAHRKLGPFQIATPGVAITQPRLTIYPTVCTATDWATLTADLTRFQPAQLSRLLAVTLPDGRQLVAARFPFVQGQRLIFGLAQIRAADGELGRPQTVVVAFTGNSGHVVDSRLSPGLTGSVDSVREDIALITAPQEGVSALSGSEKPSAAP